MLQLLMQSLLEDRFQLKARVETRDLPAYALVGDKGGTKIKEVVMKKKELDPPPNVDNYLCSLRRRSRTCIRAECRVQMTQFTNWLSDLLRNRQAGRW